jgi:tRNA modification GTPase
MNMLSNADRSIVTDIAGTTRDVLTEKARLGKVTLRLSDTAGLRESTDTVERIGIDRARREAQDAELIIAVFDGSLEVSDEDIELVKYLDTLKSVKVAVTNKSDLGVTESMQALVSGFDHKVTMSAQSNHGLSELSDTVEKIYIDHSLSMCDSAIISNARQNSAVTQAIECLTAAIQAIADSLPLEVCCVEVENTLSALGELDGRTVSEDVVARIFANFCVGK